MTRRPPVSPRWKVTLIVTIFGVAVAAAAAAGWWYARESSPLQGPVILMSVDGLDTSELRAYGGAEDRHPAIDALAADAVVFERAYAHSPLTLPAHASLLAGRLPFEHGIRDEAGFALREDARPLPELLRNRGYETGAAVSSFLLRPQSGVVRGFSFFDIASQRDHGSAGHAGGSVTTAGAAERWVEARRGSRFFLFVQIAESEANDAVNRLVEQLKARGFYDSAAIILTADHPDVGAGVSLDEAALRVPLLVKQPHGRGAGHRVRAPVQHIDVLPTVLDLVRAPRPAGLRGRSLRAALDGDERGLDRQPIYAESLAGRFRFGGPVKFALADPDYRYIRSGEGDVAAPENVDSESADGAERLRGELDQLLDGRAVPAPAEIAPADEDQLAALGYLPGVPLVDAAPEPLAPGDEAWVADRHRAAALLTGQKDYLGAIATLREIVRVHPRLAVVQYQLGRLLGRVGRREEAERAFRAAARLEPDNPHIPITVASLLLRADLPEEAWTQAALGVALAEHRDDRAAAAAHQVAARVALALDDFELAERHAGDAERQDPSLPLTAFVRGRALYSEGQYEAALAVFEEAAAALDQADRTLEDLHLHLGETLTHLDRLAEAEEQFERELRAFPHSIRAYSSLAMLYHASSRTADFETVLERLVEGSTTPTGYDAAARLWTIAGEPSRAAALRAEARTRFRAPGRVRLEADARR